MMLNACTVLLDEDGSVEFRVPDPAAGANRLPFVRLGHDEEARITALLIGDLFYREDLCARLPISIPDLDRASDVELVVNAYRQGGRTALERLEGEFALILWDGEKRKLLALRDPLGSWPLFWLAQGPMTAVSTSLECLVGLQSGRSVDQDYLADFLMWPNPHTELPCERTAFSGLNRVMAGSMIEWSPGGPVLRRRYWDWSERIRPAPKTTHAEAEATVAQLFRQAVRERLRRGPAAAHLSGGMDSSAVVCVAQELQARIGGPPIVTLSLVYPRSSLAEEGKYIDLILRQHEGLVPCFVNGETVPDYEWFRCGVPRHEEPYAGLPGIGAELPLLEAARRLGVTTILSGFGSDELFASSPITIADLLQRRRWLAAFNEARRWSRAENRSAWTFFRRYGLEQVWPQWWGDSGRWPNLGWFSVPPWVNQDFANKLGMAERGRQHARRLSGAPISDVLQQNMLAVGSGDWARWYLAAPRGLHLSHPFQDLRLMCFALGLPMQLRSVPGERKPILQSAMRAILPEAIRNRRDKRGFDDIYGLGLVRNLEYLEQMVQKSALRQYGVLDVERLIPVMRDAALGIGDIRTRERMDKTLALVAWFDAMVRSPSPRESVVSQRLDGKLTSGKQSGKRSSISQCVAG